MKPAGPKGAGGSDSPETDALPDDAVPETAHGLSPAQAIALSRAVVLGEGEEDLPIDLTEEPVEPQPAAPGHEDRTDDLPGQLLEAAVAAAALAPPPRPRPSLGTAAGPPKRSSEPPPHASFRAEPSSSVIPVPPPFVPFPPSPPEDRETVAAHRPAVQPPAPAPGDSRPLAPPPAPPAPAPPTARTRPSMPAPATPPAGPLPKVIISEEAYRPSQVPPPPAAPAPAPVPFPAAPPRPAPQLRPISRPPEPPPQPPESVVELGEDAVVEETSAGAGLVELPADAVEVLPQAETEPHRPAPPVPGPAPLASAERLAAHGEQARPEVAGLQEAAVAADGGEAADEEVTPAEGRTFAAEDTPAEPAAAAPETTPPAAERPGTTTTAPTPAEAFSAAPGVGGTDDAEEVSLRDVQLVRDSAEPPPAAAAAVALPHPPEEPSAAPAVETEEDAPRELGDLAPPDTAAPRPGTDDPFAPPVTTPPAGRRRALEEPENLGFDAPPSVISIPEDDVPRTPATAEERLAELEAAFLPGMAPATLTGRGDGAPPAGEAPPAEEVAEELGEADVQSLETEESEPSAAPLIAPERPRPSAVPRSRPRRRRRHGERRPWWEEIFDDEYIRSLPRFSAEQTRREVEFIERSLGVARGARVLDLGCGDGRHAVELASRGFEVVGLDLSLPMLARAGDVAQARSVKLNFIQGDMRDLRFESAFDAAYCVGTTFGYFDDDTNVQVLANAARALKPGGRFLLQVCNRDHVLWHQPRSTWFQGDDRQYLEDTDFNFLQSRLTVKRSWATSAGDQETVEYSIRLYSLHEMGKMFHAAGFRVIEISGQYATPGVFFGGDSPNLILLAEKP